MQDRPARRAHRIIHAPPLALPFNADSTELRTLLLPGKYLYAVRDRCPATLRTTASIRVLQPLPSCLTSPTSMMLRQVAKQLVLRSGFHREGGIIYIDEPVLMLCAGLMPVLRLAERAGRTRSRVWSAPPLRS
jgi:hypothetical protein